MKLLRYSLLISLGSAVGWLLLETIYSGCPSLLPHTLQMVRAMDGDRTEAFIRDSSLHHVFKANYERRVDWWEFHLTNRPRQQAMILREVLRRGLDPGPDFKPEDLGRLGASRF